MKIARRDSPGRQEMTVSFSSRAEFEAMLDALDREALAEQRGIEAPAEPIRTTAWVGEHQAEIEPA